MLKALVVFFSLVFACALPALGMPGDDALVAKLPKEYKSAAKVPEGPLVQATTDAVHAERGMAPQITGAAERRAIDCSAGEAVLRAALRALAPTPTALEVFAIVRSAIANAPSTEMVATSTSGDRVANGSCAEGFLVAAASEYPQFASVLNDSGKQFAGKAGKGEPGIGAAPGEPGIGAGPNIGPASFPNTVVLPGIPTGLVPAVTPTF
jgi:hypothetical protein